MTDLKTMFPNASPDFLARNSAVLSPQTTAKVSGLTYTPRSTPKTCADKGAGTKYDPRHVTSIMAVYGIPAPEFEYRFYQSRRWRFDLAWPEISLALEVQGGIWVQGRHTRGAALKKEWQKLNTAAVNGWTILYCEPADLLSDSMLETLQAVFARRAKR